jgi:hypothetical protein
MTNQRKPTPILAIVLIVLATLVILPVACFVGLMIYCHYNPLVIHP